MTPRPSRVDDFVDTWADAERRGDVTRLSRLLDDDFVAVDEGRTVDKEAWIGRYRSGGLVHHAFFWRTLDARVDSCSAFVVGRLDHSSSYCGRAACGRRTVTLTVTASNRRWQLAGLHSSPECG
jgi:ketosteroid isomerase-like protein